MTNSPIVLTAPTVVPLPKTFKQETSDYIDAITQFLEQEEGLDINTELVLEEVMDKLQQIVGYL